jgi:hypothetical protein
MSTSRSQRLFWKLIGSAVAPIVGTLIGIAIMRLFGWEDWRACAFMIGIFAVPVWLLVLLPLYVLLPRSSVLWRPTICTVLGAAAGAILVTIYFAISPDAPFNLVVIFLPIAVVVGAATAFVGAATARYFHSTQPA